MPSALQLSAMATQMLIISPQLSLISALVRKRWPFIFDSVARQTKLVELMNQHFVVLSSKVIPAMALTVGCLGEKLRAISKEANLSAASLAAYLNEVP